MAVNKVGESIGVEITGITGDQLVNRDAADKTKALLEEHGVVVYREVHIDDDDLLAFTRMLGTPVVQPTGEHKYPEIQTITSDPSKTSKVMAEYRRGNFYWHIDGAMDDVPQKGTLLTAREVDDADQGDTEFATTYRAYDVPSRRREGGDRRPSRRAQLRSRPRHRQSGCDGQATRSMGSDTDKGAPAGLDAPRRPQVAPDRRDRGRGRRVAGRQGPGAS